VLLSAEAGIGKSRLLRALTDLAASDPESAVSTAWYQCSPYFRDTPFHPFIDHIERRSGFQREDTPAARFDKVEAYLATDAVGDMKSVPLVAALLSLPIGGRYAPQELTPRRLKEETIAALVDEGLRRAGRAPLLLLFEDAHWADPTSLEVLDRLIDRLAGVRALLIVTGRPEFAPAWHARPHVTFVRLGRLNRKHSRALVEGVVGKKRLPSGTLEEIMTKAGGVALFLEELSKAVLEGGLLDQEEGRDAPGGAPAVAIPSTLQDTFMARLDRSGSAKETAQLAAVIGREFSWELLASVSPVQGSALREALARLVSLGLISARGAPRQPAYVFKHALIQEAAYPTWFNWPPIEREAAMLQAFELSVVHGLLQTPAYAMALLEDEASVSARVARQSILTRDAPPPPVLSVLMDESILFRQVGGPETMKEQLEHLVALQSKRLTIQFVPAVVHDGLSGSFILATMPDRSEVAYVETALRGFTMAGVADVAKLSEALVSLRACAYSVRESHERIRKAVEEKWT
jgi:hypothetical protein